MFRRQKPKPKKLTLADIRVAHTFSEDAGEIEEEAKIIEEKRQTEGRITRISKAFRNLLNAFKNRRSNVVPFNFPLTGEDDQETVQDAYEEVNYGKVGWQENPVSALYEEPVSLPSNEGFYGNLRTRNEQVRADALEKRAEIKNKINLLQQELLDREQIERKTTLLQEKLLNSTSGYDAIISEIKSLEQELELRKSENSNGYLSSQIDSLEQQLKSIKVPPLARLRPQSEPPLPGQVPPPIMPRRTQSATVPSTKSAQQEAPKSMMPKEMQQKVAEIDVEIARIKKMESSLRLTKNNQMTQKERTENEERVKELQEQLKSLNKEQSGLRRQITEASKSKTKGDKGTSQSGSGSPSPSTSSPRVIAFDNGYDPISVNSRV